MNSRTLFFSTFFLMLSLLGGSTAHGLALASATGSSTFADVMLTFSDTVEEGRATSTANYMLNGGLIVRNARLLPDGRTVVLTTSRQIEGTRYTLLVNGIKDSITGEEIPANSSLQFTAWVFSRGALKREIWDGVMRPVSNLLASPLYPNQPTRSEVITAFEFEAPVFDGKDADPYSEKISGWILPTVSGDYTFYLAAMADARLYLSTDDLPKNKRLIAGESLAGSASREYLFSYIDATARHRGLENRGDSSSNISVPLTLLAGKRYYVEALHGEGNFLDHVSVAWHKPGDPRAFGNADLEPIPGEFLATYVDPDGVTLSISEQPQSVSIPATTPAMFSIAVDGASSIGSDVLFQWQREGLDIGGATTAAFSIPAVALEDNGAKFRCRVSLCGTTLLSDEAVLTVTPLMGSGTLSLTSPQPNNKVAGQVEFRIDAGGIPDLHSIEYLLNGRPIFNNADPVLPLTQHPYSLPWHTANVWDGFHSVQAVARDNSGHVIQTTPSVLFQIANEPVTIRLLSPNPAATLSGIVNWTVESDRVFTPEENTVIWYYAVDGKEHAKVFSHSFQVSVNLDTRRLRNGTHELAFRHYIEMPFRIVPLGMSHIFVNVDNGRTPMELRANFKEVFLTPGESVELSARLAYTNGDDDNTTATYSTGDLSVATVSPTGHVTAVEPGYTQIDLASGDKTARVRVVVRGAHLFPHFSRNGELLQSYDSSKSIFLRSLFFLDGQQVNRTRHLGQAVREAAVNALMTGFYANPADGAGERQSLEVWKEFSEVFRFAEHLTIARRLNVSLDLTGDDVSRSDREMYDTITYPDSAERIRHAFEWARDSERVVAINMMDEVNALWGDTPTPSDGRWLLRTPPIPDDAFQRIMSMINSVPGRPLVTWSAVGNSGPEAVGNWTGNPVFSDYNGIYWSEYAAPIYPQTHSLAQTVSREIGMDRTVLGWENALQADKPSVLLVSIAGPHYSKGGTNEQFTAGVDKMLSSSVTPAGVSAQIVYSLIRGMAGIRGWPFDWSVLKDARRIPPVPGGEWLTGTDPFSVGVERWKAISASFNLVKRLEPYILQPNTHAVDLGSAILSGAKRGSNGQVLLALNVSEVPQPIKPDLSTYTVGTVIQRFRLFGASVDYAILPNQSIDQLTLEGGEAVVYLFTRDQTITFDPLPDREYSGASVSLNAIASSSLPVSFSVVSGPASIAGNMLTTAGGGKVTIRASQAGDGMYRPAPSVEHTFNVFKLRQTIAFPPVADRPSADSPFNLEATASSGLPVSFVVVSGPATLSGKELTLTGSGEVVIRATQNGNERVDAAPPVERWFKVSTTNKNPSLSSLEDIGVNEGSTIGIQASASTIDTVLRLTPSVLWREVWTNLSAVGVLEDLTDPARNPRWLERADVVGTVSSFETPINAMDRYGVRLTGFVHPPETGDYRFFMSSDDEGALFLSTDDNPANKVLIAREPGWSGSREWQIGINQASRGDPPANISAPISLESGGSYYVEALMKEGEGGDNLAVTWQRPSQASPPANGSPPIGSAFLSAFVPAPERLVFSVVSSPDGLSIDPNTGLIAWTPNESQGGQSYAINIRVTDDGDPPLNAEQTFTITVNEVNAPPVIAAISDQPASEGGLFVLTPAATDPDLPPNKMTWSLGPDAPAGMSVNAETGAISWTPDESHGGTSYPATVIVTDDGVPPLSDSKTFTITVAEANSAPELSVISDQSVDELSELTFAARTSDSDLPVQQLTFSLAPGAPEGATISSEGVFRWTPAEAQGPGTFPITIRVTDDGTPPHSAEQTFTVTVGEMNSAPQLSAISDQSVEALHELTFAATATDPDLPTNVLTFTLAEGAPEGASITSAGVFTWTPIETQAGASYRVTLVVTDGGSPPLTDSKSFNIQAVPVQKEIKLVEVRLSVDEQFSFSWSVQPGASYRVQFKANLSQTDWEDMEPPIPATGDSASFSAPVSGGTQAFYRVVRQL